MNSLVYRAETMSVYTKQTQIGIYERKQRNGKVQKDRCTYLGR